MTEHEIKMKVARMKHDIDHNLGGLAEKVNTQRVAELIVEAGVTWSADIQPAMFLTALFISHTEGQSQ